MKTPEKWINENSQSGPFDGIDNCKEACGLVAEIQRDAIASRTCDGCRHWLRELPDVQLGLHIIPHHGHCQQCSFYPNKGTDNRVQDQPEIRTGPRFGCVHWEAKPASGC